MHTANEPRVIGLASYRLQVDRVSVGLEHDGSASDCGLADAALAKPAAAPDAFGVLPLFQLQEAPDHRHELLRELLDRTLNETGRLGVALGEHLIELLLAD